MRCVLLAGLGLVYAATALAATDNDAQKPVKVDKADIAGQIFQRSNAEKINHNGHTATDVVTFTSKDTKYESGLYKSGPSHFELKSPKGYPDNEFMYFVEGGITLTSTDGTVTKVDAGEAVTIPKGWTGTWDTQGYTKMYVTYDPDTKK